MRKLTFVLIVLSLLFLSCQSDNSSAHPLDETSITGNVSTASISDWVRISVDSFGGNLTTFEGNVAAIDTTGIVLIEDKMRVRNLSFAKNSQEYMSEDGGLTRKTFNVGNDKRQDDNLGLCSPIESVSVKNQITVLATCEHSLQLWRLTVRRDVVDVDLTRLYNSGTLGYGPLQLLESSNRIFSPARTKEGHALFVQEDGTGIGMHKVWQSSSSTEEIIGLSIIGQHGWILLAHGGIIRSIDEGRTWSDFSTIPPHAIGRATYIHFTDKSTGFVVGTDGLILSTDDGGRIWKSENSGIKMSLRKIVSDNEYTAVIGDSNAILVKHKGSGLWKILRLESTMDLRDLVIHDRKLFVLVDGQIYVHTL